MTNRPITQNLRDIFTENEYHLTGTIEILNNQAAAARSVAKLAKEKESAANLTAS
jgi:hypothetical protein